MMRKLAEWLEIDSRSLAVFRVLLGVTILVDLAIRLPWVEAFLTDDGVLPLDVRSRGYTWAGDISLHALSGGAELQYGLFALSAVFAVMLVVGWQTRVATLACWLLVTSLHNRNMTILNTGDDLIRALLFWSMLLPLGTAWSLDARSRGGAPPRAVRHPAGAMLMLQVVLVYWVVVVRRHGMPEWFSRGNAVLLALQLEGYTTEFGIFVRDRMPWSLAPLAWFAMIIEGFGPLLCFSPWKTGPMRTLAVFLFLSMHLAFGLMMEIGLFWFISCISWVVFLPPWFWDQVERVRELPGTLADSVDSAAPLPVNLAAVLAMAMVLTWNFKSLHKKHGIDTSFTRPLQPVARMFRLDQGWNVYSPPGRQDAWFVAAGTLADGRVVDLRTGASPPVYDKPADVGDSYENQRWRRFLFHMSGPRRRPQRAPYASWAAQDWERRHPGQDVVSVQLTLVTQRTLGAGWRKGKPTAVQLGTYAVE